MRIHGHTLLLASVLLASAAAQAKHGLYAEVDLSQISYQPDGGPTAKPSTLGIKIGSHVNRNLAVEARLGTGMSGDTITFQGLPIKVEVDRYYGAYVKGIWPASDALCAYALLGYTRGKVTGSALGIRASDSDSDFSYGLGAEYSVSKAVSFHVEWARLFKGAGYRVDGLSVGVGYRF